MAHESGRCVLHPLFLTSLTWLLLLFPCTLRAVVSVCPSSVSKREVGLIIRAHGVEAAGVRLRAAAREHERTRLAVGDLKEWVQQELAQGAQMGKILTVIGERERETKHQFDKQEEKITEVRGCWASRCAVVCTLVCGLDVQPRWYVLLVHKLTGHVMSCVLAQSWHTPGCLLRPRWRRRSVAAALPSGPPRVDRRAGH